MPRVSGPALDRVAKAAVEWYYAKRDFLIKALTADKYPYGTVRLTPDEQYLRYLSMTEQDWEVMEAAMMNLYRGHSNQMALVQKAMTDFITKMNKIGERRRMEVGW